MKKPASNDKLGLKTETLRKISDTDDALRQVVGGQRNTHPTPGGCTISATSQP